MAFKCWLILVVFIAVATANKTVPVSRSLIIESIVNQHNYRSEPDYKIVAHTDTDGQVYQSSQVFPEVGTTLAVAVPMDIDFGTQYGRRY